MKEKKFKLERKRLEDIQLNLYYMNHRAKSMMIYLFNEDIKETFYSALIMHYQQAIMKLSSEAFKLLKSEGDTLIVNEETIETFVFYTNIIDNVEDLFAQSGMYSLKVH